MTGSTTDRRKRCDWAYAGDDLLRRYHDEEWGVPVHDDVRHFEFLVLEGAQAGLSWLTILRKRPGYSRAFSKFDPAKVARFTTDRVAKILLDPGIVRNRRKVESVVRNAKAFREIQREFGSFDRYAWPFVGGAPILGRRRTDREVPPRSDESDRWSEDLRRRGLSFVGSTIVYAHMQATGMVNDHLVGCYRYREVRGLR